VAGLLAIARRSGKTDEPNDRSNSGITLSRRMAASHRVWWLYDADLSARAVQIGNRSPRTLAKCGHRGSLRDSLHEGQKDKSIRVNSLNATCKKLPGCRISYDTHNRLAHLCDNTFIQSDYDDRDVRWRARSLVIGMISSPGAAFDIVRIRLNRLFAISAKTHATFCDIPLWNSDPQSD